jgi:hypothetical protein
MRASRQPLYKPPRSARPASAKPRSLIATLFVLLIALLPAGAGASPNASPQSAASPPASVVTGAEYTLASSQFQADNSQIKEQSFKGGLSLPTGARDATFTSGVTRAPINFTDVAARWSASTPDNTSVSVELRTSPDGRAWSPWLAVDEEDIIMPQDTITETYGGLVPVAQGDRTNRFVQSRVTLQTIMPGVSPVFRELAYTFINAGVTANPPKPQLSTQVTPSDVPKPAMVSRKDWGAPEGESSPRWTPKYKRVTHIIIHHTATPNNDTDYAARVRAIWYYHANTRGWGDIGYNYLIDPNGVIYEGRAGGDDVEAGHAYPFNSASMGVGMIGNFMTVAPSAAAQAALIDLISWKANQRGIDPLGSGKFTGVTDCDSTVTYTRPNIAGHRDFRGAACGRAFNTSTCPGDRLWNMLPQIRAAVIAEQPPLRALFTQHDTPGSIEPGSSVEVHLTIRNSGSLLWPASGAGSVSLGYRWLTPDNKPVAGGKSDGKVQLPRNVSFADTLTVTAKLSVPTVTGHYALVWDMYRDGIGWFADQGSHVLRVDVVIGKGTGDKAPPKSSVLPLPVYSNNPDFLVRWAGEDEPKGSGIASYDIQYRIAPNGPWTDWQSATAQTQATFEGEDSYTYEFRSRARDAGGNVEVWPDKPSAYTTVDTRPPPLKVDTPLNGDHVPPGPLLVKGHTEPGTFVAVNDTRAEEVNGVFTSTIQAAGRDFAIHITAADAAGNLSRLEITVQAAPKFNDVPMSHPDFLAVEQLSDLGIISGYTDGSFRPDEAITRAQFAKILAKSLQWGLINPQEGRFTDVPQDSWMYPYIETIAARGVITGYSDNTFLPNNTITRGKLIKALVTAAGWKLTATNGGSSEDIPPGSPLLPYIETAYSHEVLSPDANGRFNPSATITRGDVSLYVYNMLKDIQAAKPSPEQDGLGPQR